MTATVRGISVDGRSGSISVDGIVEFDVVYKVGTDNKKDGPNIVMAAFGIPSIGNTYFAGNDVNTNCVAINKTCNQVDAFEWEVTVSFSNNQTEDPAVSLLQDDPLNVPAEVSYGFQTRRIIIPGYFNDPTAPPSNKDWQQGIFSPNGELFTPQPEADIDEPTLVVKKNFQTVNGATMMALNNAVNIAPFQGAEARQLRLKVPNASRKWHKSIGYYWEVTYTMAYRWETWDIQVLNQGTYYWTGGKPSNTWSTTQQRKTKKDDSGNILVVNLTTNGDINTTSTPTFTRIRYYREINFGSLLLGI